MKPTIIESNKSLKSFNWWKIGGEAQYFSSPKSIDELISVWDWAIRENLAVHVLSGGSNILVPDGCLSGLTICLHELKGIESTEIADDVVMTCLAGTAKSEIAKIFLQNRLPPAIFLTGIPGDIGGGVVMNAGIGDASVPREFCEIVDSVEVLRHEQNKFNIVEVPGSKMQWEYRHSSGWQPGIIVRVRIRWPNKPERAVVDAVRAQTRKRVASQPLDLPSCGSVFRNPHGHKAAELIQNCGLKGFRIGGAVVSEKHANFIVNDNSASSSDIHGVIDHVKSTVLSQTGIELKTEVVYFGSSPV